jgi:hypothetical protein
MTLVVLILEALIPRFEGGFRYIVASMMDVFTMLIISDLIKGGYL